VTSVLPDESAPFAEVKSRIEKEVLDQAAPRGRLHEGPCQRESRALARSYKLEVKHQDDLTRGRQPPRVDPRRSRDRQIETLVRGSRASRS